MTTTSHGRSTSTYWRYHRIYILWRVDHGRLPVYIWALLLLGCVIDVVGEGLTTFDVDTANLWTSAHHYDIDRR